MTPELCCPVCSADLPLNGDEKRGDEIFCTFCGSPFRLQIRPKSKDEEGDDYSAEEDF
jgi:predicted amidophosphoribosyltransferase